MTPDSDARLRGGADADWQPDFSVIVPTYGRPEYLDRAIESILSQSLQDFEIVVVDDCSPAPVSPSSTDPRIRLIRAKQNGGPAAARNLGVEHARGRYLAFLDDDDIWLQSRLALAREGLRQAPVAVCWQYPGKGRLLDGKVYDTILDGTVPQLGATALHRRAWHPMPTDMRSGEDAVWWVETARRHPVKTIAQQGLDIRRTGEKARAHEIEARIIGNQAVISVLDDYFSGHPVALAHRWLKQGRWHGMLGDWKASRRAYLRAFRVDPSTIPLKAWARTLVGNRRSSQ